MPNVHNYNEQITLSKVLFFNDLKKKLYLLVIYDYNLHKMNEKVSKISSFMIEFITIFNLTRQRGPVNGKILVPEIYFSFL